MKRLLIFLVGILLLAICARDSSAQTITNQPQSLAINDGSSAVFSVGVTGATNYQWQFNGTNLSDGGNITGSTNSILNIEGVTSNQAGTYSVVINSNSVVSSNAVLTIVQGTIVTFVLTNFPAGGTSNIEVELFNHDKPVTVQNFLHYVNSGAYSNMFIDRNSSKFVLQGGDYVAADRNSTNPPLTGAQIAVQVAYSTNYQPAFPYGITNESGIGPFIHNDIGTLAMALGSDTNSASSAFFFNLTNNSQLDGEYFTVFGRVLSGSNVLQYFYAMTNGGGGVTSGSLEYFDGTSETNSPIPYPGDLLPVNYIGTNAPANTNLLFCSFAVAQPPNATNLPVVQITSSNNSQVLTNGVSLTVQGTATDPNNLGLAWVRCDLIPLAATDGTLPNGGTGITNYILGATNWVMDISSVPPGTYMLGAQAQDEASNVSAEVFLQPVTVSVVIVVGNGSVTFQNGSYTNLNAVGYPFQSDVTYSNLIALPGTNSLFEDLTANENNYQSINPAVSSFGVASGLVLTATFLSNTMPGSLAITSPAAGASIGTGSFSISGTISNAPSPPVTITCQIYAVSTLQLAVAPLTTTGTNSWTEPSLSLPIGSYIIQAIAVDSDGDSTLITNTFSVSAYSDVTLNIIGLGTVSGVTNNEPIYDGTTFMVTAVPNPGQAFYAWDNPNGLSINPSQTYTMSSGLVLTPIFVSNNSPNLISFTYPTANAVVGENALYITGTISNALATPVNINCQVFSSVTQLAASQALQTTGSSQWEVGVSGLPDGNYTLLAQGSDAAGDNALIAEQFSVAHAGALHVVVVGKGTVSPVTNGQMLVLGTNFQATATPAAGEVFYTWNNGAQVTTNATQMFTMANNLTLTATFIPSNTANGLTFTYPANRAVLKTNKFLLKGRIAPSMKSANITCQLFQTNGVAVGSPMTTSATDEWSIPVTNLPGGFYLVEAQATNAAGKSTIVSENFAVLAFAEVQGTYSGLFICSNEPVAPTNSGFLTFTLTPTGAMTGKLELPAYPAVPIYSLPFDNIEYVAGSVQFGTTNFHGSPLNGFIEMSLAQVPAVSYGTISSSNWSSPLVCYRAATQFYTNTGIVPGKYVINLQSQTNGLPANGYATLNVAKNGTMTVAGVLPDNTTFSESARISGDGIWPLYALPNGDKTQGLLLGWNSFTNGGNCTGQVYWYKAPKLGQYYTGGVGLLTNVVFNTVGGVFARPAYGSLYSLVFSGGTLPAPVTNIVAGNSQGQFIPQFGADDNLKMSLAPTGLLSGSFSPDGVHALRFTGAFINPALGGSGIVPETGGIMGAFELKLQMQ